MDGRDWLDSYQQRLQDIRARAYRAEAELAGVEATVASSDGSVTVVAGPGGAIRRIVFSERAEALTRTQLAALTVATVADAQVEAARRATDALEPLLGADSDAMQLFRSQIPSPS